MNPLEFVVFADKQGGTEVEHRVAIGRYYYGVFNYLREELKQRGVTFPPPDKSNHHKIVKDNVHILDAGPASAGGPSAKTLVTNLHTLRKKADYEMTTPISGTDRADAKGHVADLRLQTGKW